MRKLVSAKGKSWLFAEKKAEMAKDVTGVVDVESCSPAMNCLQPLGLHRSISSRVPATFEMRALQSPKL